MPSDRGHQLANRIRLLLAGGYVRSNNLRWRRSSRAALLYDPAFAKNDGPVERSHGQWPVGKASTARSAAISGASALRGLCSLARCPCSTRGPCSMMRIRSKPEARRVRCRLTKRAAANELLFQALKNGGLRFTVEHRSCIAKRDKIWRF
jgi:hypothetical protein